MSREVLITELRSLSRRELERTLQEFSAAERARVMAMLNTPPGAESARPPFDVLAGLSPWLLKAIEEGSDDAPERLTPAARSAVRAALHELASAAASPETDGSARARSLLSRFARARSWMRLQ